jgi:hypothetical protein
VTSSASQVLSKGPIVRVLLVRCCSVEPWVCPYANKTDGRLVKQIPYRLNPKYKEKLKVELDRMLEVGIIEPFEESECIIPMVVQDKKNVEIRICVDLRKLNDACLHDPFPTPFTDEVLDNVGGQEVYSFTDEFS